MRTILALSAAALFAAAASAQLLVVPAGQIGQSAGANTGTWAANGGRHFQNIYDSSLFTGAGVTGPITITRLRWRQADGVVSAGGNVWTGVTVQLSTSLTDYLAPSTTFALNRGGDNVTVFSGNVTALAATGSTPNTWVIDIPLTTPFTYNPTFGQDLCVEVAHGFANPTTGFGAMATGSSSASHFARRVGSTSQSGSTGTLSDTASVMLLDFTGPGGYGNISIASVQTYGDGCYRLASSCYELFASAAAFDLRGVSAAQTNTLVFAPAGAYSYVVTGTTGSITPPVSTPALNNAAAPGPIGDDDFSAPITLPFPFPHPGGSTNTIHIAANGYIQLGGTAPAPGTGSDYTPSIAEFLGQTARLAPLWHDWHCTRNVTTNTTAGVYYDVDPTNTRVYITWQEIGEYATAAAGASVNTFQVMLDISGLMEFRYGAMGCSAASTNIAGYARGLVGGQVASDPLNRDISATLPFTIAGPDGNPLTLAANRPVLGTTVTYTTSNIPSLPVPPVLGGTILSFVQINPGLDLGFLGAPGCRQYANASGGTTQVFLVGGLTSAATSLTIPSGSSYIGLTLFAQSFVVHPTANTLGVLTSNGLASRVGAF